MRVIAQENTDRPTELVDITITMGDDSVQFSYPLFMINQDTRSLELGIDEFID